MMAPKIIFEDTQVLVIDKPSGVVVNRAETVREETVQEWIERKLKAQNSRRRLSLLVVAKPRYGEARWRRTAKLDFRPRNLRGRKLTPQSGASNYSSKLAKYKEFLRRSGIVHRLDKETSGLLVIAKTPDAFEDLKAQFKKREVEKRYLALVHGEMEASKGEIFLPIKRVSWDREKFGVVPDGKKARTRYRVCSEFKVQGSRFSFLEVEPQTGRTHQIRVHLKHLDHPIVSDLKYGGRRAKKDRQWCPRLFLHASFLSFNHPETFKRVELETPLPKDLEKTLSGLKRA